MENNKLIAEFMGLIESSIPNNYYSEQTELSGEVFGSGALVELKFDSSWNWLIPVVQLCKERQIFGSQNLIDNIDNALSCDLELEPVYNTVLKFIEYYNRNKK